MTEPTNVLQCAAAYPHHAAMERMAMPNAADYETLKRSIKEHGLRMPLVHFVDTDRKEWQLDGRGRVKAMEELGMPVLTADGILDTNTVHCAEDGHEWTIRCERYYADQDADPDKIVADLNLARRQLTVEQKRVYVANLLKAFPDRSNNSIARIAGVSDHTVASIRTSLETTSQIAKLPTRTGADGKTRAMPVACPGGHHWARELQRLGRDARLIPPQYVRPFVKTNKNDAADAEGICEAVVRPNMRFVPVKSIEQQAAMMLMAELVRIVEEGAAVIAPLESGTIELRLATGEVFHLGDKVVDAPGDMAEEQNLGKADLTARAGSAGTSAKANLGDRTQKELPKRGDATLQRH